MVYLGAVLTATRSALTLPSTHVNTSATDLGASTMAPLCCISRIFTVACQLASTVNGTAPLPTLLLATTT